MSRYVDCHKRKQEKKLEFVRQYDEKYMELAFTVARGSEQSPRPLCLVCDQVLSNNAMKPSKLARHFHSKHGNLKGKPVKFFERLLIDMNNQKKQLKNMKTSEKSLLRGSYLISPQIAKTRKPYTIGEKLVKACILSAAEDFGR
ncbi:zinc finger MYM-type protein 6-like [Styela clava]